jgi:hypothetical protein
VPSFGHNFGFVPVHADAIQQPQAGAADVGATGLAMLQRRDLLEHDTRQIPAAMRPSFAKYVQKSQQIPIDEDTVDDYWDGSLLGVDVTNSSEDQAPESSQDESADQTFQDAGPPRGGGRSVFCANGGGSSACDLDTGAYKFLSNDNTCCTKDCTQQHEMIHVVDHTAWGCCKKASDARRGSANPGKVVEMYRQWAAQANLVTECHAYTNDVKCATAMEKANDCAGRGKDTDCCFDIGVYKRKYLDLAADYCKRAPAKVPRCPLFGLASSVP